jgi:DNA-binding XRE family transcriptional regulator
MINVVIKADTAWMADDMHSRLIKARKEAGFASASAAARRLSVPLSTYSAHENGQNAFDIATALFYAGAFKTTASWLLTGERSLVAVGRPGVVALPLIEATVSAMADLFQLPLKSREARKLVAEGIAELLATRQFSGELDETEKHQLELEILRVLAKAIHGTPNK